MDEKVLQLYKPLTNQIEKINLFDSLYLIWCYSRNYSFNEPFPPDFELRNSFNQSDELWIRRMKGINEFELEFLHREFILHANEKNGVNSILNLKIQAGIIDYIRGKLDNELVKLNPTHNILLDANRMFHRQFKWQIGYSKDAMVRYHKIFSHPILEKLLNETVGLNIDDIHFIGLYLFGASRNNFALSFPLKSDGKILKQEKINLFFSEFSFDYETAKKECAKSQRIDHSLFYTFNPITSKPIFIYKDRFFIPLHQNLFRRITEGVYYSIVNESGFDNAFGESFEKYIGLILKDQITNSSIKIISEFLYGKDKKKSSDWILEFSDSIMLIECKTKRMTFKSKSQTELEKGLETDLEKMADAIVQIYKQCENLKKLKYIGKLNYEPTMHIIPVVLTLEPWFIELNPELSDLLLKKIKVKMNLNNLNTDLLSEHPYMIIDCARFEGDIQIINCVGVKSYVHMLQNNKYQDFIKEFGFNQILEGEYDKLYTDRIRNLKKSA
jgi:hypothetical protein